MTTLQDRINHIQDEAWLGDPAERMGQMHDIIAELVERLNTVHLGVILARGEAEVAAAHDAADLLKPFNRMVTA